VINSNAAKVNVAVASVPLQASTIPA
jgi:hypothetical protein